MRNSLLHSVLLLISVGLVTGSVYADDSEILRRLDLIEQRLNKLESSNDQKNIFGQALENALRGENHASNDDDQSTDKSDLVNIPPSFNARFISIKKTGKNSGLDMPVYEVVVNVSNESDKSTTIINAYVDIKDKADNLIARIKWDGSKGIAAGETIKLKGQYSDNPFDNNRLERLYEIDKKLLNTHFNVYKVVFEDGNVVEYKKCIMCEF